MEEQKNQENKESQVQNTSDFNLYDAPTTTNDYVETPVENPIIDETVIEEPQEDDKEPETPIVVAPVVEPVIQEKIVEVEKIVEKFPEFKDDYSKQMFHAIRDGKEDEVFDYLSRKNKNYGLMSDFDVVKEDLKILNPRWTEKDVDLELQAKYGKAFTKKDLSTIDQELEPELYEKALSYNENIEQKELLLSREARDARIRLEDSKKNIEFPKIQEEVPKEVPLTPEKIDELNQKWEAKVVEDMSKLSDFKFQVNGEEVIYKLTDEEKSQQTEYMKDYNGLKMAKDLGWVDNDGNENVLKIAEDMLKLKHFDKIIAATGSKSKTSAIKEVVSEIKNLDFKPQSTSPETSQDLGARIWS